MYMNTVLKILYHGVMIYYDFCLENKCFCYIYKMIRSRIQIQKNSYRKKSKQAVLKSRNFKLPVITLLEIFHHCYVSITYLT